MDIKENIAGLGKDRDKDPAKDLAKKQSQAEPATENLDIQPNSVNKQGDKAFLDGDETEIDNQDAQIKTLNNNPKLMNIKKTC